MADLQFLLFWDASSFIFLFQWFCSRPFPSAKAGLPGLGGAGSIRFLEGRGGEPQCGMQLPAHGQFGQTANGIRTNELKRPHKTGVQNPSVIREKSVRHKSGCPCRPRAWMGYAYGSLVTSQALAPLLSIARNGFNLGALLNGIKKKKKWGKKCHSASCQL